MALEMGTFQYTKSYNDFYANETYARWLALTWIEFEVTAPFVLLGAAATWNSARKGHIFRNAVGHVNPATAAEEVRYVQLFTDVTAESKNLVPPANAVARGILPQAAVDNGVVAFVKQLSDGRQVWVQVKGGEIINAGINVVPK